MDGELETCQAMAMLAAGRNSGAPIHVHGALPITLADLAVRHKTQGRAPVPNEYFLISGANQATYGKYFCLMCKEDQSPTKKIDH